RRRPLIMRRASWFNVVSVALGLAFLYLPIVILVIYSFNASRLVGIWGGRFPPRVLFSGLVYAPLVMPEVITGLSLLLLFVALDVDRGFWTITLSHTTLTMCFVTVVVQ